MPRPDTPSTVYLDSSAVIAAINKEPGHEPVQRVIEAAMSGRITLLASPLLYVEARGRSQRPRIKIATDADEDELRRLLDTPLILPVEFNRFVAFKARDLALKYSLKNYDAIHLASAIFGEADVLMAWDHDFPFDQSVEGVWVSKPYPPAGPDLYAQDS